MPETTKRIDADELLALAGQVLKPLLECHAMDGITVLVWAAIYVAQTAGVSRAELDGLVATVFDGVTEFRAIESELGT